LCAFGSVILGSTLLVVKMVVPEIKAKQTGLLVLQSIGSLCGLHPYWYGIVFSFGK
jgi:hypothetical protein